MCDYLYVGLDSSPVSRCCSRRVRSLPVDVVSFEEGRLWEGVPNEVLLFSWDPLDLLPVIDPGCCRCGDTHPVSDEDDHVLGTAKVTGRTPASNGSQPLHCRVELPATLAHPKVSIWKINSISIIRSILLVIVWVQVKLIIGHISTPHLHSPFLRS